MRLGIKGFGSVSAPYPATRQHVYRKGNDMSKLAKTMMILGLGAGFGLFTAAGSAVAQDNPCQARAEHRLQEYGLTMSDLNDVEWIMLRSGRQHDGPVVSYHMWSTPKSCSGGNLVIDMNAGCDVMSVYTQGGCAVKGVASY
jgi:hypothetical protein